ncbi:MAG: hypothetical protein JO001_27000 [Alphaproteobacteria bacterium]|nr:hypothetical protein [Alphaproteobacteria bacterium]
MPQRWNLAPEERAQMMQIQDRLIELFVDRDELASGGDHHRADELQVEIDELMRQLDDIKSSADAAAISLDPSRVPAAPD